MEDFVYILARIKKDIFVSYAWNDNSGNTEVDNITDKLRRADIHVWQDKQDMYGDLNLAMEAGIRNSTFVALFVSQRYLQKIITGDDSESCCKEFRLAVTTKDAQHVIVIFMDGCVVSDWTESLKLLFNPSKSLYIELRGESEAELDDCVANILRIVGLQTVRHVLNSRYTCSCGIVTVTENLSTCCYTDERCCNECASMCRSCDDKMISKAYSDGKSSGAYIGCPFCAACGETIVFCEDCTEAGACVDCEDNGRYCESHRLKQCFGGCDDYMCEKHAETTCNCDEGVLCESCAADQDICSICDKFHCPDCSDCEGESDDDRSDDGDGDDDDDDDGDVGDEGVEGVGDDDDEGNGDDGDEGDGDDGDEGDGNEGDEGDGDEGDGDEGEGDDGDEGEGDDGDEGEDDDGDEGEGDDGDEGEGDDGDEGEGIDGDEGEGDDGDEGDGDKGQGDGGDDDDIISRIVRLKISQSSAASSHNSRGKKTFRDILTVANRVFDHFGRVTINDLMAQLPLTATTLRKYMKEFVDNGTWAYTKQGNSKVYFRQ
jgi:hypothetical protein